MATSTSEAYVLTPMRVSQDPKKEHQKRHWNEAAARNIAHQINESSETCNDLNEKLGVVECWDAELSLF